MATRAKESASTVFLARSSPVPTSSLWGSQLLMGLSRLVLASLWRSVLEIQMVFVSSGFIFKLLSWRLLLQGLEPCRWQLVIRMVTRLLLLILVIAWSSVTKTLGWLGSSVVRVNDSLESTLYYLGRYATVSFSITRNVIGWAGCPLPLPILKLS